MKTQKKLKIFDWTWLVMLIIFSVWTIAVSIHSPTYLMGLNTALMVLLIAFWCYHMYNRRFIQSIFKSWDNTLDLLISQKQITDGLIEIIRKQKTLITKLKEVKKNGNKRKS